MSTALLVMWLWAAQWQTIPHTDITGNFTARSIQIDHGKVVSVEHACITRYEDGLIAYNECADPVDVPAVRHSRGKICLSGHNAGCQGKLCKWECDVVEPDKWTCSDKSRVLLTSEDGAKHCIKFGGR